ncbi:Uncharacterised protein [Mycobacteroides abscessus subsp. massiliense]|nr:Uncharacterised protein [Mycobacteroides abscessus subsp. massiliense]SLA74298.1 Uncharacterised protein [Mycobacteroides abscessus subsp. massiliense]
MIAQESIPFTGWFIGGWSAGSTLGPKTTATRRSGAKRTNSRGPGSTADLASPPDSPDRVVP